MGISETASQFRFNRPTWRQATRGSPRGRERAHPVLNKSQVGTFFQREATASSGPGMLFGSPSTERVLETGGGYALPNGITGFLRAEGNAPATILRAIVAPVTKP